MKTQYQFIHFVKKANKPKTSVWSCRNNNSQDELGEVKWYPAWRQYAYFPTRPAIYSAGCLEDIQDFIRQLTGDLARQRLEKKGIQFTFSPSDKE